MSELEWQRKMKAKLMCFVIAETFGTAQIDVVTSRHLERPYVHLVGFP